MNLSSIPARFLVAVVSLAMFLPVFAANKPYPLKYWALREVVSNVEVSPDGKYLALEKIATRDANPVIEVYDTSDFKKKPFVFNADPMEITSFDWVGDQDIIVRFRQRVREKIEGFNEGVYETQLALLDVKEEKVRRFRETNPSIANLLPNKPNKVILSFTPGGDGRLSKVDRAFRPLSYHELDIQKGTKKLLMQGKISMGQVRFNADGFAWTARGFDRGTDEYLWYARLPGESDWEEIFRLHEDSFESFSVQGFDHSNPEIIFVIANNGRDKEALWEFNIRTKSFGEIIYARSDVNVAGVRRHSNSWTHPDTVVGVGYYTDKLHFEYFDAVEGATYAQLEGVIPDAYDIRITSRSRDGQVLTIYNSGPHDPGSYYLLKDGKLKAIGSNQPLLKSADLADVKYINYQSRDGKTIHAYITVPHGEPPFPTVVMPHGGPFVSETVGFDEWGQMLANNGYLVLQPQYRGSTNYGLEFYLSAFKDGGQGGYKMQDDKDDGVLHLIKEGLADPDNVAMYGWSYGGYAALVAAARTPQIYQCVIAGAAVSDPMMQISYYSNRMRGAQEMEQRNMWIDSVSPIDEAEKVNVPLMLIHGSVDQRVPPAHVRKYMDKLDKYGKPYEYVELDGADHFYSTLFYDHQITLYESMIRFLRDDCGPGGMKS
jgi:dipeptidyl aminopeptidase/acylaminoacyl peptidase